MTLAHVVALGSDAWRVNYVPEDFLERRGGDLIVEVDAQSGHVIRVVRGQ